ncbi:MAG: YlbF family regulator [Bacillota bacterium]|jgi:cell fate (sporulation/competence/biofilm development) regulator YlbF (YheA/YmcA/DUF963 family)
MATYDKAHELARELKSSEEYKEYQKAKQAIQGNSAAMSILRDFQEKQIQFEMGLLTGREPDEKAKEEMQKITDLVNMHGEVKRFLDAERRILIIMSDIQKILTDALNLLDYRST